MSTRTPPHAWGGGGEGGGERETALPERDSMTQHLQDLTGLPRSCACECVRERERESTLPSKGEDSEGMVSKFLSQAKEVNF
jgi:hypothetical protein